MLRHSYMKNKWMMRKNRCYSKNNRQKHNLVNTVHEGILDAIFESEIIRILGHIFPLERNFEYINFFNTHRSKEEIKTFISKNAQLGLQISHKGFKIAQNIIIKHLLLIQSEVIRLNDIYKKMKRDNTGNKATVRKAIKLLKYKETILKNLADTIFWQIIQHKLYIARRFYQEVPGSKTLIETNYESVLNLANQINQNPNNFVLLTDITSNIQIGDLFGFVNGSYNLIEVKEGDKNHSILETIMSVPRKDLDEDRLSQIFNNNPYDIKQAKRIIKQVETASAEIHIMNNDTGIDPVSNKKITIQTPEIDTEYYCSRIKSLEKQLESRKNWAYDVIDECLHIGLYKGRMKYLGSYILKSIAETQGIKNLFLVDCRSVMHSLDEPIFYMPLSKNTIMDILSERAIMYLMLDIDKFMELYVEFGAKCQWISHRAAINQGFNPDPNMVFEMNNKMMKVKNIHGIEYLLAKGSICKILFDHIRPRYVALSSIFIREK